MSVNELGHCTEENANIFNQFIAYCHAAFYITLIILCFHDLKITCISRPLNNMTVASRQNASTKAGVISINLVIRN